ncbi:MAG: hypothetical protein FD187_2759 [bacterium]|nr:MAG: hypothetical protein FD142_1193 [bacterium]KAF0147458.1 MAG: hypothetical protein FD187_2759 [bacterium]KAF0166316.1 MAG: hypothetical protein FD158_2688 [bacterium]TXT18369.1 MAG: hypothetical protein FD132_2121 [bacterium]
MRDDPLFTGIAHEVFQSAPGREAGRCTREARASSSMRLFQSAPGREAGRCSALVTECFDCGVRQACASHASMGKPGRVFVRIQHG